VKESILGYNNILKIVVWVDTKYFLLWLIVRQVMSLQ